MNSSQYYVLQLKVKENIIYQHELSFNKSSNLTLTIKAANFSLVNGGLLTASLYRITQDFVTYYTNVTGTTTTTNTTKANTTATTNATNATKSNTTTTTNATKSNTTTNTTKTNTTNTTTTKTNITTTNTTKTNTTTNTTKTNFTTNSTIKTTNTSTVLPINRIAKTTQIISWLSQRGEILFFKKPSETL